MLALKKAKDLNIGIDKDGKGGYYGQKYFFKNDGIKQYDNNEELLFTNQLLFAYKNLGDEIDQKNYQTVLEHLDMNVKSIEILNLIQGFGISQDPDAKSGKFNSVVQVQQSIDQCMAIITHYITQLINLVCWNYTTDKNDNVTKITRNAQVSYPEAERFIFSYVNDLQDMFEKIIQIKTSKELLIRKINIEREKRVQEHNANIGETIRGDNKVDIQIREKPKKSKKSKKEKQQKD